MAISTQHHSGFAVKPPSGINDQVRCCCGKLLAKQDGDHVVIRCARCKQEMRIKLKDSFEMIPP